MGRLRRWVQALTLLLTNGYYKGFLAGNIYRGALKKICVPGLNCYSCPGALGSCPIGSLQAVISEAKYNFSYYIMGFLILVGTIGGRFICGWMCPFGFIQELLNKIPSPHIKISNKLKKLTYVKYAVLLIFVIILPAFWVNEFGRGSPTFCKYICPAGTLEGGIPLVLLNQALRQAIGFLFMWKVALLILTIVLSIVIFRPFCRYICPLGAIYALFNPISLYRFEIDRDKCTNCGLCQDKCKLDIEVYKDPNSYECIRCGECISACPHEAITTSLRKLRDK